MIITIRFDGSCASYDVPRQTECEVMTTSNRVSKRQLPEVASGEIEAAEVLPDPTISPADARFFIQ